MPQGFEIIRARIKDSAAVLIDRLMRSKRQEIVLILPKNSIITADLNSLKILKEEAESIGKTLSLSTQNNDIESFAKKINMLIYNFKETKNEQAKKPHKVKIMMDILPPSFNATPNSISPEEEMGAEEKEAMKNENVRVYEAISKNSDFEKNLENFYIHRDTQKTNEKLKNRLLRLIYFFIASGLLLFTAAMYLILPKANINISLNKIPLKAQIPVAVSKNISSPNLTSSIIPGQYFSSSKSGSKTIEGSSKIGGVIEIYNAYSATPQKLVAQTRFETKDGQIFRIQNPVVVPGAKMSGTNLIPSSVKTQVIANLPAGRQVTAGNEYLIGPSFFTIPGFNGTPKYAGFYAKSDQPMTTIENSSITKGDLEKNKNELKDQLVQELKSDALSSLNNPDLKLIDGASSASIDDFKVTGNNISMKITWQALLFKETDLRNMINYFVANHYADLKNFIFEDNIVYPQAGRVDFKKGELFFTFNIDKDSAFPADIGALKKELVGQDEGGMRTIISNKNYVNSASIYLWPFWVKKAPDNLDKINITIDNK